MQSFDIVPLDKSTEHFQGHLLVVVELEDMEIATPVAPMDGNVAFSTG